MNVGDIIKITKWFLYSQKWLVAQNLEIIGANPKKIGLCEILDPPAVKPKAVPEATTATVTETAPAPSTSAMASIVTTATALTTTKTLTTSTAPSAMAPTSTTTAVTTTETATAAATAPFRKRSQNAQAMPSKRRSLVVRPINHVVEINHLNPIREVNLVGRITSKSVYSVHRQRV